MSRQDKLHYDSEQTQIETQHRTEATYYLAS